MPSVKVLRVFRACPAWLRARVVNDCYAGQTRQLPSVDFGLFFEEIVIEKIIKTRRRVSVYLGVVVLGV